MLRVIIKKKDLDPEFLWTWGNLRPSPTTHIKRRADQVIVVDDDGNEECIQNRGGPRGEEFDPDWLPDDSWETLIVVDYDKESGKLTPRTDVPQGLHQAKVSRLQEEIYSSRGAVS